MASLPRNILRLLRVYQWPKNLLVLMPLIFSKEFDRIGPVLTALSALAAFCLVSSATYIFNDLCDLPHDRQHPKKRLRPIASGQISIPAALLLAALLMAGGAAIAWEIRRGFLLAVMGYAALSVSYTLWLKRMFIVDVIAVALGFVVRAMAGAVAISVVFSNWLVVCTLFLALFLSLGKRRGEIVLMNGDSGAHRKVLAYYTTAFIDQMLQVTAGAALITYTIYTCSPEVVSRLGTDKMYLTLPFVVYGLARYLWLVNEKGVGADPSSVLLRDWRILVSVMLWGASCVLILYLT